MMHYFRVERIQYVLALVAAKDENVQIRESVSHPSDLSENARFWLSADSKSGFGITDRDELIGVFSTVNGRGEELVRFAINEGAVHLDCYAGFLDSWYTKFGFVETKRETNWNGSNHPDVVYMSL